MLGIIFSIRYRQFKQNFKYKRYRQWGVRFLCRKPYTNYGDKKSRSLRPTNLNPQYEIKLHIFTWPLYPKDLFSSTYNLIYVYDETTLDCFSGSLQPHQKDESLQTKIQRINPWMRDWEWCDTLSFLSRKPSLENMWYLINHFSIFYPLRVIIGYL